MNKKLIPQFVFLQEIGNIEKDGQHRAIVMDEKELLQEIDYIHQTLSALSQDKGDVYVWIFINDCFDSHLIYEITNHLEEKIKEYLESWDVEVLLIPKNTTSTMENIVLEVEEKVHKLAIKYPREYFAHISSSSYSLLSQAILLEGIRQFENRYLSVYRDEGELFFIPTNVTQPITTWKKQFREFILDYDYQVALQIITDIKQSDEVKGIKALLQMMVDRFNFSFDLAMEHLEEAEQILGSSLLLKDTKDILKRLVSPDKKVQDLERICELFRQIDVFIEMDDLPSFLVRFYRVREAILFYLLNHQRTIENDEGYINKNRKGSIYHVFDELEKKYISWDIDGNYGAYFYLKSANVAGTLNVRNQSFLGHSRNRIEQEKLWSSYFGTSHISIEKAKKRFSMDTALMLRDLGIIEDENLLKLNRYLLELTKELEKEVIHHA